MSSILHSLRNLFSSPTTASAANNAANGRRARRRMTRARAQRIARGEEEDEDHDSDNNENGDDGDVSSAFGDDDDDNIMNEEGSQLTMMQTQEDMMSSGGGRVNNAAVATSSAFTNEHNDTNTTQPQQGDDKEEPSQQQQHEPPKSSSPSMQEFFQHILTTPSATTNTVVATAMATTEKTLSYKEWKEQRQQFLMEYFTHRLIPSDDDDDDDDNGEKDEDGGGDDATGNIPMDECSFHSEVLDKAFDNSDDEGDNDGNLAAINAAAATAENENEESDDDEEEEPLQTQQQLETRFVSGIKRKFSQSDKRSNNSNKNNNSKKKRRKEIMMKARMTPGQMWDGNFLAIPHVSETMMLQDDDEKGRGGRACHHLKEMDLYSSSVNLGLCRVIKVWSIRFTRRMDRLDEEMLVYSSDNDNGSYGGGSFVAWEDDGPLNTMYKKVISIEVVQLENGGDVKGNHTSSSLAMPTFCNNPAANNQKSAARKRRHTVRRVRIFFYNKYALVMNALFQQLSDDFVKRRKSPVLLSLVNVPPECIMPVSMRGAGRSSSAGGVVLHPHLQQYVNNPFGDEELGVLSPYCICIGDRSAMKLCDDEKIRFDGEGRGTAMEIRLVEAPADLHRGNLPSEDIADNINVNDAVVNATSIRGGVGYFLAGESGLIQRYLQMLKGQTEEQSEVNNYQNSVINAEECEMASGSRHDVENVGIAARGGNNSKNSATGEANAENTDPNANSVSTGGVIVRPRSVASLGSLPAILIQGRKEAITVYGVVLGFSPPRITRMNTWMMSIVMIDETIPSSREMGSENEKELYVPSITLNLFAKHKSELPQVRSAGDVIVCQKVLLQEYNNEPQLRAKKNKNIIVVRPRAARSPDDPLLNSTSPEDWSVSVSDDEKRVVDLDLTNALWRWGQLRLSTHPTMSPNCYIAISQVSDQVDNFEVSVSGDITAIVTSILPIPEHLRRRDTPRGFLRLWDGTGPSRSDPMPESVVNTNADQYISDPPEQVLIRIEKILMAISSAEQPDKTCAGVNAPLALCGRVINAIIWEEDLWNLIQRDSIISIGSFVRLRNINNAMLPSGSRVNCLSVHAKSSLTPLPYDAYEVKMLLKGHDTRLKRGVPTNPTSAILPGKSAPRPQFTAREAARSGFSMLDECLRKPAPATFTVQFEVSHTLPASDLNSIDTLKAFCVKQKNGAVFRFAMHIKDASAEVDVICHGKVAEQILGMSAQEVSTSVAKCTQALDTLKEYISVGSVCEGKIRSVMGKDKRVYFVLCSMFCITSEFP
ncbi:hypothetical protein ACHAXM_002879 [Skeletonema potamos]